LKVPAAKPSVNVKHFWLEESCQPDVLYSTERVCFLNCGYPFFPGFLALQLAKKRWIAKMARSCRSLTRHRVKFACPFKLFGHDGTLFVEVNQLNSLIFDPVSKSFISDKLSCPNHFVDDSVLLRFAFQLKL
jgi:hypothetical protein